MEEFNNAILEAGLEDAGYHGKPYTWSNSNLSERIDRDLINSCWAQQFEITAVTHLDRLCSDHAPILIDVKSNVSNGRPRFRFQNMWCTHKDLPKIVQESWEQSVDTYCPLLSLHLKMKRLKMDLSSWNKNKFGNIFENIKTLKQEVKDLEDKFDDSHKDDDRVMWNEVKAKLQFWYNCEEIFWKQKAAIKWWKEGEANTKFFHNLVKKKRKRLFVDHLMGTDGNWITTNEDLETSGVEYFGQLLSSEGCTFTDSDFAHIPNMVTDLDNNTLLSTPTLEEVKEAIFSIHKDSAPGPDGFGSGFFQYCWDIIKSDLLQAASAFLSGSHLDRAYTSSLIVLVPKSDEVSTWKDFRPISLSNVKTKFLSKILVNRLRTVISDIISPNQSGFTPGRDISDNILLAQELFHSLNKGKRGGNIALKLDMEKAYDRMEWSFVMQMLTKFGFSPIFRNIISNFISNSWFSLLINGKQTGFFKSSRGLKQGDPLSPILFILASEFLSRGLNALMTNNPAISYYSHCATNIFHLAYADDCIIFCNGAKKSIVKVLDFLNRYQTCSGQKINKEKSSFICPKSSSPSRIHHWEEITHFVHSKLPFNYLGCPIFLGNPRNNFFDPILNKIRSHIGGWEDKWLSKGAKLVLINHVLMTIPLYTFQVIPPTKAVQKAIEKLFSKFLWSGNSNKRCLSWAKWEDLCFPLDEGGLGIWSLSDMQICLPLQVMVEV
ncbi:Putative ribonuclease H protein [Apostasia shenzhenica]|uniref:Ribonuclease H protein n=1 Tax=Apostasia shenzhenica TaxID=1088818 RepID=A0A2H9ZZX6_9ASPA|nr:Putative ribonuclease H protein [Apostasia shenzhenica]